MDERYIRGTDMVSTDDKSGVGQIHFTQLVFFHKVAKPCRNPSSDLGVDMPLWWHLPKLPSDKLISMPVIRHLQ